MAGDLGCAFLALAGGTAVRLWLDIYITTDDIVFGTAIGLAWPLALAISGGYRRRVLGEGSEEFRAVVNAWLGLTAVVAISSYMTQATVARSYVVAMLPVATLFTLVFHHRMRRRLHRRRAVGINVRRVVAVGHESSVLDLVRQFKRQSHHGMKVVAACVPYIEFGRRRNGLDGVPVMGDFSDVALVVDKTGADAVAVLACPELDGAALRRLAWSIETKGTELFVAPALLDVAGPRTSIRPMAGMPLLYVEHPRLDGAAQLVKSVFDKIVASLILLAIGLPMLVIGLIIRSTSPGPALFYQVRVGRNGQEFKVVKFRTMRQDAEQVKLLLTDDNEFDGVLFKIRNDPRITGVGGFLRRYSLDELPQLFNVMRGDMSLVGPRPPLPSEVEQYGADVRRRLVVKPGITGLWQVSGRSDLSWEESVRLDLRYVENWSLMLDLQILWKTISAVIGGEGAY
ncbi:sugar transferase [Nonomuraea soli]|uniref:Exopolysaccharide biosynthesis polyprenyl glycosylphosphotransferase n=1 Tax=Nonomuraea soli TaxID=1032476 RepID=A0A7W0HW63_9ACTN|nr:sugar transferase [Nonomuraea soli]MBA2897954.1 exopolysaccharide biosynthesis polyprenyl glycosylphosphotransferase [Nonomuraea soli]